jgi:endo-1,4-beta-D-glucanase Y
LCNTYHQQHVAAAAAAAAAAACRWRHWGQFTGAYAGHEPTGETIELYGMAIATVTDSLQVSQMLLDVSCLARQPCAVL